MGDKGGSVYLSVVYKSNLGLPWVVVIIIMPLVCKQIKSQQSSKIFRKCTSHLESTIYDKFAGNWNLSDIWLSFPLASDCWAGMVK
jgi:hypothetical protein